MTRRDFAGLTQLRRRLEKIGGNQSATSAEYQHLLRFMGTLGACTALQSRAEIAAASRVVRWLGLPSHHDPQKNWDTLKCFYYILEQHDPTAPVLDMGASMRSVILAWLNHLGYQQLHAIDVRRLESTENQKLGLHYSTQDLTHTAYADNVFQAITAISVIEHGVSLELFVAEAARLVRPGGVLLISTDYWSAPVDCTGIYPYGEALGEMKVFQRTELEQFCTLAARNGFTLCRPLDLDTDEPAVYWKRVNRSYTFAFIALRKTG